MRPSSAVRRMGCIAAAGVLLAALGPGSSKAANWWDDWTPVDWSEHFGVTSANGRSNVYETHPKDRNTPFRWLRTVTLGPGPSSVHMEVSARADDYATCDWVLAVVANGQKLRESVIHGTNWQVFDVDLSAFSGQTVNLELWNKANGWHWEVAYWDKVEIVPPPAQRAPARLRPAPAAQGSEAPADRTGPKGPGNALPVQEAPRRARREVPPEIMAAQDRRLRARIAEKLAEGSQPEFFYAPALQGLEGPRERARVISMDEKGALRIASGPAEHVAPWQRLSVRTKASLAMAVLRDASLADHCLAAFYLLAGGDEEAGEEHLRRAGKLAAEGRVSQVHQSSVDACGLKELEEVRSIFGK